MEADKSSLHARILRDPKSEGYPIPLLVTKSKDSQLAGAQGQPYPYAMARPADRQASSADLPAKEVVVHAITDAQPSLTEDQAGRMKRYFISMMIRTSCFVLAVILPSPYRWIALVGAMTLPYIAVVVANAGRETILGRAKRFDDARALP